MPSARYWVGNQSAQKTATACPQISGAVRKNPDGHCIEYYIPKFDVHGSAHRKCIFKYNQQDETLHNLFISVKYSTCFRQFLRPSSGAQKCVYSIRYCVKPLLLPATTVAGSSKDLTKYRMLYTQFWAPDDGRRNRLKHVEHFTEINKLCNVASCWLYLKIYIVFINKPST